jgi:hypothetical protein
MSQTPSLKEILLDKNQEEKNNWQAYFNVNN